MHCQEARTAVPLYQPAGGRRKAPVAHAERQRAIQREGMASVADAWMRRSDPAGDALPRRHDTRCLTPGILPSGLRASLRLIQIAPGDLVGIDIDMPGLCRGRADHCVYRRSCGDREDPHTLGCEDG
jgi:hypothetical protein